MTAKDLMVGDLLRVNSAALLNGTIVKVIAIDGDNSHAGHIGSASCRPLDDRHIAGGIWCDHLDPIPLTPEILEKNGFKDGQFFAELLYGEWQIMCDCSHIAMRHEGGWLMDIPCKYVHELQHCLKLVGIDKEIVL